MPNEPARVSLFLSYFRHAITGFCAGMRGMVTDGTTARRGLLRRAYRRETAAERPLALIFRRGELAGLRNRGCSRCRCSTTRWSIETGANFTSLYSLRSIQNRKGSLPGDILGSEEEKGWFLALIFDNIQATSSRCWRVYREHSSGQRQRPPGQEKEQRRT